jgi:hypothetical protein
VHFGHLIFVFLCKDNKSILYYQIPKLRYILVKLACKQIYGSGFAGLPRSAQYQWLPVGGLLPSAQLLDDGSFKHGAKIGIF